MITVGMLKQKLQFTDEYWEFRKTSDNDMEVYNSENGGLFCIIKAGNWYYIEWEIPFDGHNHIQGNLTTK